MWAWLYLALFGFAGYLTHLWLVEHQHIYVTSLLAAGAWFFLALAGGSLDLTSSGVTVAVPSSGGFQVVCLAFGLVSLVSTLGYYMGAFPPDEHDLENMQERDTL